MTERRAPLSVPPSVSRYDRAIVLGMQIFVGVVVGFHLFFGDGVSLEFYVIAMVLPLSVFVLHACWYRWKSRRVMSEVTLVGGKVCSKCDYTVQQVGNSATCPECGTTYTSAELLELWGPGEPSSKPPL